MPKTPAPQRSTALLVEHGFVFEEKLADVAFDQFFLEKLVRSLRLRVGSRGLGKVPGDIEGEHLQRIYVV